MENPHMDDSIIAHPYQYRSTKPLPRHLTSTYTPPLPRADDTTPMESIISLEGTQEKSNDEGAQLAPHDHHISGSSIAQESMTLNTLFEKLRYMIYLHV